MTPAGPMVLRPRKLHLGCGLETPPGWVNLDGSWGAWLGKYPGLRKIIKALRVFPAHLLETPWNPEIVVHDVRRPLPFAGGYFEAVYASHLLEHLYLTEAQSLLRECHRVLRPGGIIRLVVPDLRAMVGEYYQSLDHRQAGGEPPADRLNRRLGLREERPPAGGFFYRLYTCWKDYHSHKWMYDGPSLIFHLLQAGFAKVEERALFDSRIEDIQEVEKLARVHEGGGLCVEGIKPPAGHRAPGYI